MRLSLACRAISVALALSGCSSANLSSPQSSDVLPLNVGHGIGSQYGNYEMRPGGETHGPEGQRCLIFNWDRPLNRQFAVRYTSASCESKEHPVWMTTTDYTRKVIPIAQSNLKAAQTSQ
jgi:hypothetical protein